MVHCNCEDLFWSSPSPGKCSENWPRLFGFRGFIFLKSKMPKRYSAQCKFGDACNSWATLSPRHCACAQYRIFLTNVDLSRLQNAPWKGIQLKIARLRVRFPVIANFASACKYLCFKMFCATYEFMFVMFLKKQKTKRKVVAQRYSICLPKI